MNAGLAIISASRLVSKSRWHSLFAFRTLFAVYLNAIPGARKEVDPIDKGPNLNEGEGEERSATPIRRLSHRFSVIMNELDRAEAHAKTS
jgi:hypothetical protein